jgi:hypothetical protein
MAALNIIISLMQLLKIGSSIDFPEKSLIKSNRPLNHVHEPPEKNQRQQKNSYHPMVKKIVK